MRKYRSRSRSRSRSRPVRRSSDPTASRSREIGEESTIAIGDSWRPTDVSRQVREESTISRREIRNNEFTEGREIGNLNPVIHRHRKAPAIVTIVPTAVVDFPEVGLKIGARVSLEMISVRGNGGSGVLWHLLRIGYPQVVTEASSSSPRGEP